MCWSRPSNSGASLAGVRLLNTIVRRQFGRSRMEYGLDKIDEVVLALAYVTLHDGAHVRRSCSAGLQDGARLYRKFFGRGSFK